jgi:uncharacterized protein YkwD
MKMKWGMALLLAAVFSFTAAAQKLDKSMMLQLINKARSQGAKCGGKKFAPAPPLAWNNQLEQAAVIHARDMSGKKFFNHTGSDGSTAADRMERSGYAWKNYGENIGLGYQDEQEAVAAWLSSTGHCRNIMNPQYTEIGAARSGSYWTQVFGSK